jgi:hypothetical protein
MPTATTPRWPTVLLSHEFPDATSHVDWMIASEPRGLEPLVTFRLESRLDEIDAEQGLLARRISDHRAEYLTYEGPVSGERGTVRRLTRGTVVSWERSGDRWHMEIQWPAPDGGLRCQNLRLTRRKADSDAWLIELWELR